MNTPSLIELWDREYGELRVIPSSTREAPSKAFLLFSELLQYDRLERALDLGCGIGRNAIYLAKLGCEVDAVDFSREALRETKRAAEHYGVGDRIRLHRFSLFEPLPLKDASYSLIIDSYVFCHFTDEVVKKAYRSELRRLVKPDGYVYVSLFTREDGYYSRLITNGDENPVIVDPNNGIAKQLYGSSAISRFFQEDFDLLYRTCFEFEDVVLERPYRRSVLILVLKPPQGSPRR